MPTIINLFLSYRCAKHGDVELTVVQPSNSLCQVQPCPCCAAEREDMFIELQDRNQELVAAIREKQNRLANLSKPKTRKNKQGEYLKGGKK